MYVTNINKNIVYAIDTTTNTVSGQPIKVGKAPFGIAFDPTQNRMYITNINDYTVSVLTTQVVKPLLIKNMGSAGIAPARILPLP